MTFLVVISKKTIHVTKVLESPRIESIEKDLKIEKKSITLKPVFGFGRLSLLIKNIF